MASAMSSYDVFVSYRHTDSNSVEQLVSALERRGLRVWFDRSSVSDFGSISASASEGLSTSKAVIAYYSATYPHSSPCQWELTQGFLASMKLGDPCERVLVVNPEPGHAHIEPADLRDALYASVTPPELPELDSVADRITSHVANLQGELGHSAAQSKWLPSQPSGATRFAGRFREMWQIHSGLHARKHAMTQGTVGPGVLQVRGMGGVGKSLLAREYALRFSASYPGGIFWLYAQGDVTTSSSPADRDALRVSQIRSFLPSVMGVAPGSGMDALSPEETEAIFRNAIAQASSPCLWVVDDLPENLEAGEVYRWLGPESSSTLITSRSGEYGALMPEVPLGVLEPDEAVQVLQARRTPSSASELLAARQIASELGCHALAIDVAGATLKFQSFAELLENLSDPTHDELELAAAMKEELPTGRERSIASTLSRSLDRLGEVGQDLMRIAAMLARDPIPTTLLTATFQAAFGSSESEARIRTMAALDDAFSLSLIADGGGSSWQIHPLVARTVGLKDTELERQALLKNGAVSVLNRLLEDPADPDTRRSMLPMVAHAARLALKPSNFEEAQLCGHVAEYDFIVGDYVASKVMRETEVAAFTHLIGPTDTRTFAAQQRLGETLNRTSDFQDARVLLEDLVSISQETFGDTHRVPLLAMRELSRTLYLIGDTAPAVTLATKALEGLRSVLGPDDLETLNAMSLLARTLEASGDFTATRSQIDEALVSYRRACGPDHPDTLRAMSIFAKVLYDMGELEQASAAFRDVVATMRTVLSDRHPETLLQMNNFACVLWETGVLEEARALAEEALKGQRELLGSKNLDTVAAMDTLGCILRDLGDLDGARALGEEAVEVARERLGTHHVETITEMINLADTLRAMGDLGAARTLGEEALANCNELGSQHPLYWNAMTNLAVTLRECGDTAPARQLAKEALSSYREALGPDHPHTIRAMGLLEDLSGGE